MVYKNSGEINFKLERKKEAVSEIYDKYSKLNPNSILDFDGYRIEFDDWWFNIRLSNTEPYLRLVVEAKTDEELQEHFSELKNIIQKYQ